MAVVVADLLATADALADLAPSCDLAPVAGARGLVRPAVGGGGGIGMQVVKDESQIERAMKSCSDRGAQAFGDARLYL